MQIVSSYKDDLGVIRLVQQVRLYNISNPWIRSWRRARHNHSLPFDLVDKVVLDCASNNSLTVVDGSGQYFEKAGIKVTCIESSAIAKLYNPNCIIEPDAFTHRPTYVPEDDVILFKYPWFLKYALLDDFIDFLTMWVKSTTIIAFSSIHIQHNHLKYRLIDIVQSRVNFSIKEVNNNLWIITPNSVC